MDHSDRSIEALLKDGQAAVAGIGKGGNQTGEVDRARHRDDVTARHRDVAGRAFAEMKKVAGHLPLDRRQVAAAGDLALVVLDRFLDLNGDPRPALFPTKGGL